MQRNDPSHGTDCGIDYRGEDRTEPSLRAGTGQARLESAHAFRVTIHDVAPATQARCSELISAVERGDRIPMTLLVVPHYHHQESTSAFERWIETRLDAGDELALHGFTHLD